MHYVIWGAGIRGEKALKFLGKDRVLAFVDEKKVGQFHGFPLMTFSEFVAQDAASDTLIVVTPLESRDICQSLDDAGIFNYVPLDSILY
jgi:hypothetical protein